jgi:spermidine-citrate ligase
METQITFNSFMNAYLKTNQDYDIFFENNKYYIFFNLRVTQMRLKIELNYYSITGRHQFKLPGFITQEFLVQENQILRQIDMWGMIKIIVNELEKNISKVNTDKFLMNIKNSHNNLGLIFEQLKQEQITSLYLPRVCFQLSESGLLGGHQIHPSPKNCDGFGDNEFITYFPEFRNQFQMHYFLAPAQNVMSASILSYTTNDLIERNFLIKNNFGDNILIPVHPWQAKYIQQNQLIKKMLDNNTIINLGPMGRYFTATTSVRSVYCAEASFMLKLSLNVMITNSVRMNYTRELSRAISVAKFWQSHIASGFISNFPNFSAITDPAYVCLHDNGKMIEESAVLFRNNPFVNMENNVTCLAALCHDSPIQSGNRFNSIIPAIAQKYQLGEMEVAILWFEKFLTIGIEPLLWLFTYYEIALEAHQQNLVLELNDDGYPKHVYYRDSQGYYISYMGLKKLNDCIYDDFAQGSSEFISHHFTYYLISNSVFGIINALGYCGVISEAKLISVFQQFIIKLNRSWKNKMNNYLETLLYNKMLPFKDNLATKLCDLDELTAPLEHQSVYVNIINPFFLEDQENSYG